MAHVTVAFGARVAAVTLTADKSTAGVGEDVTFTAALLDALGQAITDRRQPVWDVDGSAMLLTVAEDGRSAVGRVQVEGPINVHVTGPGGRLSATQSVNAASEPAGNTAPSVELNGTRDATGNVTVEQEATLSLDLTGTFDAEGAWGYRVDWGDGTIVDHTDPDDALFGSFSSFNPLTHSYSELGDYTVTVTAADEWGRASSVTRTVSVVSPNAAPASVTVSPSSFSLTAGQVAQLVATARDAGGGELANVTVSWSSSDTDVATVDSTGLVTAVAEGEVTITATATNEEGSAQGTSAGDISAAASEDWPNLPAGMVALTQRAFDAKNEDGWGTIASGSSDDTRSAILNPTSLGLPACPKSPSNALQILYPVGFHAGFEPYVQSKLMADARTRLYLDFWILWSPNWKGENPSFVNKMFHLWCGGAGGSTTSNFIYLNNRCEDAGSMRAQFRVQGSPFTHTYDPGTNNGATILSSAPFIRGQWHRVTLDCLLNDPGVQNGSFRMWVDNLLSHDYSNIGIIPGTFKGGTPSKRWYKVQLAPTWGGVTQTITEEQFFLLDHCRADVA